MGRIFLAVAVCLVAASALADQERRAKPAPDPRVELGLVSPEVMEGSRLFFEETFRGNGRVCATCHVAADNLQIDRATIRALPSDAPFFAQGVPGLEQPGMIRQGLVLEHVDGFANPPMFRSTPHVLSLSTSITSTVDQAPGTDAVGWSSDGAPAPGTLRDFATGAVRQHFTRNVARREGKDFRLPTDPELDALLAFQLSLGRTADIDLAAVRFADPQAERGRPVFLDSVNNNCQRCHAQAGASRGLDGGGFERKGPGGAVTGNQAKDTNVDALRVQFAPHDDGRGTPGDEQFSPPPLIEAADSAPFFHVGTVDDLESAVRFYTTAPPALFSGSQQTFGEDVVQDLGAVLRVLNASLNAQMAIQRIEAAALIAADRPRHSSVGELLDLAAEEAADGATVLRSDGTKSARLALERCSELSRKAAYKRRPGRYSTLIARASAACMTGSQELGTGLTMQLGAGNLAQKSASFRGDDDDDDDDDNRRRHGDDDDDD